MAGNTMMAALSVLSTMLAMAPSATAHMVMKSPVPFGHPNNSPLEKDGSDYPCKMPAASIAGAQVNEFKVGENQTLSFEGTAVHGGGSCQLSVTFDNPPTKNSKFKVIQSLVGGCPSTQRQGSSSTFSFQVPPELPNGDAIFAWTWFNHIGQREMYMNCALVKISGGKDDKTAFDTLPDIAVANLAAGPGSTCKTTEGFDYEFENPGQYVQTTGPGPFMKLCGGPATGGSGSGSGSGNGNGNGAAAAPAAPAPPPAAPPAPARPTALISTVQTMVTVTTSAIGPSPTGAAPAAPAAPTAPATGGQSCAADGQVVCNGESQFGICSHGNVAWQAVAAGTKCLDGKIAKRNSYPYHHAAHRAHRRDF